MMRFVDIMIMAFLGGIQSGTPECRLSWGEVKKLRAVEIYEKQKNR